jgi:hypothetical protein
VLDHNAVADGGGPPPKNALLPVAIRQRYRWSRRALAVSGEPISGSLSVRGPARASRITWFGRKKLYRHAACYRHHRTKSHRPHKNRRKFSTRNFAHSMRACVRKSPSAAPSLQRARFAAASPVGAADAPPRLFWRLQTTATTPQQGCEKRVGNPANAIHFTDDDVG